MGTLGADLAGGMKGVWPPEEEGVEAMAPWTRTQIKGDSQGITHPNLDGEVDHLSRIHSAPNRWLVARSLRGGGLGREPCAARERGR